jgi:hypothetical protein
MLKLGSLNGYNLCKRTDMGRGERDLATNKGRKVNLLGSDPRGEEANKGIRTLLTTYNHGLVPCRSWVQTCIPSHPGDHTSGNESSPRQVMLCNIWQRQKQILSRGAHISLPQVTRVPYWVRAVK